MRLKAFACLARSQPALSLSLVGLPGVCVIYYVFLTGAANCIYLYTNTYGMSEIQIYISILFIVRADMGVAVERPPTRSDTCPFEQYEICICLCSELHVFVYCVCNMLLLLLLLPLFYFN